MDDIEQIRRRKIAEMQRRLKERKFCDEHKERERQEIDRILGGVLTPDAVKYLRDIHSSAPGIAERIEETIIGLVVQKRIQYRIDKVIIKAIERKIRGIEPTISFVRKGKRTTISDTLKGSE